MLKLMVLVLVVAVGALVMGRPQDTEPAAAPAAAPAQKSSEVTIVNSTHETDGKGTFQWSYQLSDGTEVEQSGYTIPPPEGSSDPIVVVRGSYKYPAPDGTFISRSYIADQNGFQPMGDDIPGVRSGNTKN